MQPKRHKEDAISLSTKDVEQQDYGEKNFYAIITLSL